MNPWAVETSGLGKVYKDQVALNGVDIRVRHGTIYGLVGPNGSGKTTLLSILARLRQPSRGSFTIDAALRKLTLLPDTPDFEPWLSAFEVVDLARALVAPELPADRVREVLLQAGLGDAIQRRVGGFSRGMLQRLGIATALIGAPAILLLDEPCSALDPQGRREILDLLSEQRGQLTVIFSSHILSDVQEICDDIGILNDGNLLFQGSLHELLSQKSEPSYRIRLREGNELIADALRKQTWVTDVTLLTSNELQVKVLSLDSAERELVQVLGGAGAVVISIWPEELSLEQVFLEVTK